MGRAAMSRVDARATDEYRARMARLSEDEWQTRGTIAALVVLVVLGALAHVRSRVAASHAHSRTPALVVAPEAPKGATLRATIEPGRVSLAGAVPSEAERRALVAVARSTFPTFDVEASSLTEDTSATPPAKLRAALSASAKVRWGTVAMTPKGLFFQGETGLDEDTPTLAGAIRRAANDPALALTLVRRRAPETEPNVLEAALGAVFVGPLDVGYLATDLDEAERAKLVPVADTLRASRGLVVTIEAAPCDEEPITEWKRLTLARAVAVERELERLGVPASRLRALAAHKAPVAPPPAGKKPPARVRVDVRFRVAEVREP